MNKERFEFYLDWAFIKAQGVLLKYDLDTWLRAKDELRTEIMALATQAEYWTHE